MKEVNANWDNTGQEMKFSAEPDTARKMASKDPKLDMVETLDV